MRTRSIVIAVSIIMAMVIFFMGIMVIVRFGAEGVRETARQGKMKVELPSRGIILRYSEGLDINGYYMIQEDDYTACSDDNIQIDIYADGRVIAKYIPEQADGLIYSQPPREEMTLSSSELEKLKDMIQRSGIRFVADLYYSGSLDEGNAAITVSHDGTGVSVSKKICLDESYPCESERESCLKLMEYAADIMGKERTSAFREEIENWKSTREARYDFSDHLNGMGGTVMMSYIEELVGTDKRYHSFSADVRLDSSGRVAITGSHNIFDEKGTERFNEIKSKLNERISSEEVQQLQEKVKESGFAEYCRPSSTNAYVNLYGEPGSYRTVRAFSVSMNDGVFYAVDDGTNPKLSALIDEYLRVTTNGVSADDYYRTSDAEWTEIEKEHPEIGS